MQFELLGELVLQPAHVAGLRQHLHRFAGFKHALDPLLCLPESRGLGLIHVHTEDLSNRICYLSISVALHHVQPQILALRIFEAGRKPPEVRLLGDDGVRFLVVVGDMRGTRISRSHANPVSADEVGISAQSRAGHGPGQLGGPDLAHPGLGGGIPLLNDLHIALRVPYAYLGPRRDAAQKRIDHSRHIVVDSQLVHLKDLDQHVESWWGLALQNGLLGPPAPRLIIRERDSLDSADRSRAWGLKRFSSELPCASLRACTLSAMYARNALPHPNLFNDDHFGHMVLNGLDHTAC